MRILLVEFSWHANEIIRNKEFYNKDVIVSLDPECSYLFKKNNVKFFESYEFCKHKDLWNMYKEITEKSKKIVENLDIALWETDSRFKNLKWTFFNDYYYPLKISFDQLYYYSELIYKIVDKYKPTEIVVADSQKIIICDNSFLIDEDTSILKFLLNTFNQNSDKIKITTISKIQNKDKESISLKNIGESIFYSMSEVLKRKLKNFYYKINFWTNYYISKPKYLSVDCFEISRFKKIYPAQSKQFISYEHKSLNKKKKNKENKIFFEKFIYNLNNETDFCNLILG